jgi:hypothetical protein
MGIYAFTIEGQLNGVGNLAFLSRRKDLGFTGLKFKEKSLILRRGCEEIIMLHSF